MVYRCRDVCVAQLVQAGAQTLRQWEEKTDGPFPNGTGP
jgi:hypothetical protein